MISPLNKNKPSLHVKKVTWTIWASYSIIILNTNKTMNKCIQKKIFRKIN